MGNKSQTLERIRKLGKLVSKGVEDELIRQTLDKLLYQERCKQESGLKEIEERLKYFEEQYNMDSEIFYQRFTQGKLSDAEDLFEWEALYRMCKSAKERLTLLEDLDGDA